MSDINRREVTELPAKSSEQDARLHESGGYGEIGLGWDDVYSRFLKLEDVDQSLFDLVFRVWDDWGDAAVHDWRLHQPTKSHE